MISQSHPTAEPVPEATSLPAPSTAAAVPAISGSALAPEFGGREGLEPTRYGDWEKNGRCIDF
ncbi:DUF1674 domain-containing protein [Thermomonas paludicola]|uniref:DUF1674 domain-containing protein n=1 Tax=Thermomonas paludicola TaxID=2884874 RepID=UPI002115AE61|nr:DUF1674 domain-containing protein [Thermomonas paludicola]